MSWPVADTGGDARRRAEQEGDEEMDGGLGDLAGILKPMIAAMIKEILQQLLGGEGLKGMITGCFWGGSLGHLLRDPRRRRPLPKRRAGESRTKAMAMTLPDLVGGTSGLARVLPSMVRICPSAKYSRSGLPSAKWSPKFC